jgi:hypothetical protein
LMILTILVLAFLKDINRSLPRPLPRRGGRTKRGITWAFSGS